MAAIQREEWDFSPIFGPTSENELEACLNYEKDREVFAVRPDIFAHWVVGTYKYKWPEWPQTPYLKISGATRKKRVTQYLDWEGIFPWGVKHFQEQLEKCPRVVYDEFDGLGERLFEVDEVEHIPFTIIWDRPDSELVRQFAKILKSIRPRHVKVLNGKKGKGSWQAQLKTDLKALGAFRILRQARKQKGDIYKWAERWTMDHNGKPLYDTRKGWITAEKRAKKFLVYFG